MASSLALTDEQEKKFAQYGCASRCLLFLANLRGTRKMTKAEFISEFSKDYPFWEKEKNWGGTNTGMILEIARKLNLPPILQTFRAPEMVRKLLDENQTNTVLLLTEKRPAKSGGWEDFTHCRIVLVPQSDKASWSAVEIDDAILPIMPPLILNEKDLSDWSVYFYVLSSPKPDPSS